MELTTYKSERESNYDISKFMHCFINELSIVQSLMKFNINGNGWYSLDSLTDTSLCKYFYNELKYLCEKQKIDLNEYYIFFSVGINKLSNTHAYLGSCSPGESLSFYKNDTEIDMKCDIQVSTYYNNSSNIVIIGTEEKWEMNETIDSIYFSLPKMNTSYVGKNHGFYYIDGNSNEYKEIKKDYFIFSTQLNNVHFVEYNLYSKPRLKDMYFSHYESLDKCIKDNNVIERLQKLQCFKYCYNENESLNNITRELFDNIDNIDYKKVNCETLSCSESELIMQHFNDCDYSF